MSQQQREKYGNRGQQNSSLGAGLVSLGALKRTKSAAVKLAVPKPLNLPSLKKENAGNDPTTQLVPSGQAGWSRGDGDTEQHHESRSSLIEKATWASGEAANHLVDQGPRPWDRVRSLNPQEFPSLSAAAHGNSNKQLAAAAALQNVSASEVQGNWDEDERSIATRPQGSYESRDRIVEDHALHNRYHRSGSNSGANAGTMAHRASYSRETQDLPGYERRGFGEVRPWLERGHSGSYGPVTSEARVGPSGHYRDSSFDDHGWGNKDRHGSNSYSSDGPRYNPRYDAQPMWQDRPTFRRSFHAENRPQTPRQGFQDLNGFEDAAHDPELFPPAAWKTKLGKPSEGLQHTQVHDTVERDLEREAFNAELEIVAAQLEKESQQKQKRTTCSAAVELKARSDLLDSEMAIRPSLRSQPEVPRGHLAEMVQGLQEKGNSNHQEKQILDKKTAMQVSTGSSAFRNAQELQAAEPTRLPSLEQDQPVAHVSPPKELGPSVLPSGPCTALPVVIAPPPPPPPREPPGIRSEVGSRAASSSSWKPSVAVKAGTTWRSVLAGVPDGRSSEGATAALGDDVRFTQTNSMKEGRRGRLSSEMVLPDNSASIKGRRDKGMKPGKGEVGSGTRLSHGWGAKQMDQPVHRRRQGRETPAGDNHGRSAASAAKMKGKGPRRGQLVENVHGLTGDGQAEAPANPTSAGLQSMPVAFAWSSPLADEVARLQLTAAATTAAESMEALDARIECRLGQPLLEPAGDLESTAAAAAADVLGDVITALPADLSLELDEGTQGTVNTHAGSASPPMPGCSAEGFGLPVSRGGTSPPPFPGTLFPLPGVSSLWQPQPLQKGTTSPQPDLATAMQSFYGTVQPAFTFGTHTSLPQAPSLGTSSGPASPSPLLMQFGPVAAAFGQHDRQVQYGQLGHSAFVPTGRQPDWSSPASSTAFAAPSSKPLCQEALTLPAGHPFESDITAEAVFGPDIMNQPTAVKFNGAATPSLRQGHQDPASTLPDDVFCETEPPMHQLAQSYNNPRQGARRSRGGRQSANGYASRGGHAYGRGPGFDSSAPGPRNAVGQQNHRGAQRGGRGRGGRTQHGTVKSACASKPSPGDSGMKPGMGEPSY